MCKDSSGRPAESGPEPSVGRSTTNHRAIALMHGTADPVGRGEFGRAVPAVCDAASGCARWSADCLVTPTGAIDNCFPMERISLTALAAALVALGAASCATTTHEPLPPLTSIDELEVDYDAQVTSGTWDPKIDASFVDIDISTVEDLIDISTSFVELDPGQVEQLLGAGRMGPWAVTTDRAGAQGAIDRLSDEMLGHQQLTLANGQRGTVLIANQIAYVERFDIKANRSASIADPVVGIAQEGLLLDIIGSVEGETVKLDIELHQSKLRRPVSEVDVELPGALSKATIQQPVTASQTIHIEPTLRADQVLLIAMPIVGKDDRILVALVSARPIARTEFDPQAEATEAETHATDTDG